MSTQNAAVKKIDIGEMREAAELAARMLKSLSNDHRLMILCLLSEGEMSVGQISEYIDLDQSPLSQHLARLRSEGLVKTRKVSQTVFYSLDSKEAKTIIETLYKIYCPT